MRTVLFYIALFFLLVGCEKKEVGPQFLTDPIPPAKPQRILIGNEGTFGFGNASLSLFDRETNVISNGLFSTANGIGPGDIVQSIEGWGACYYVVVNNSGKVEVLDTTTFERKATISGLTSPRYFLPISQGKAFVSDFLADAIAVVDLNTYEEVGSIAVGAWTEEMVLHNGKVFVTAPDTNLVWVIDAGTNQIDTTLVVGESPSGIVMDKNDKIWVLTSGGFGAELGKLVRIDPTTLVMEQTLVFNDINDSPNRLTINGAGDQLYYLNEDIYRQSITSTSLTTASHIDRGTNNFYGLGIDPINDDIYVTDAIDFVQAGWVFRYNTAGVLQHQALAGVIPQAFYFER